MPLAFTILAILTLAGAIAAMTLRNLVHCALALTVSFAGLAGIYLLLNAQFVGFAQILIYIGAVAILIVFAILLTRGSDPVAQDLFLSNWWLGVAVAVAVFIVVSGAILTSTAVPSQVGEPPQASVAQIGEQLMTKYILPLEVLGLLLTAALIGAVIIALQERRHQA
jgi:NADH-quinone oxidoreductase subunit J